jgi:hypothetical protein
MHSSQVKGHLEYQMELVDGMIMDSQAWPLAIN